jgi:glutamate-1-semialdehyde 2,1-aminomutase
MYSNSQKLFDEAIKFIPGGVNSPARAFKAVKHTPVFIKKGKGSRVYDEDGNIYIDYISSWGPLILGHNHKKVFNEVKKSIKYGSSFGLPTKKEIELAKIITQSMPSIEKVRLTTSGTEAAMSAIRLARAYTKRNKVIKFEGCYHGHSDPMLVKAGSAALTYGNIDSNGVTSGVSKDTITLEYNNINEVEKAFKKNKNKIACLIVEPVAANIGVVLPKNDFLKKIRELTKTYGSLLIFDEVITGFRLGIDGAQGLFGIKPDLTVLGKIIGGGFPIGAFGGSKVIMDLIAPEGGVYHAGTLSGNPVSVTAGLLTIEYLKNNDFIYKELEIKTYSLVENIKNLIKKYKIKAGVQHIGSLFTLFFTDREVTNMKDALKSDTELFGRYFKLMLDKGIMLPPSQFEANFISIAHSKKDISDTIKKIDEVFKNLC